jgi:hypothetical protein
MQLMNATYRSLERLCRHQAGLTGHEAAKRELEEMAREYKRMADWQEQNLPPKE